MPAHLPRTSRGDKWTRKADWARAEEPPGPVKQGWPDEAADDEKLTGAPQKSAAVAKLLGGAGEGGGRSSADE